MLTFYLYPKGNNWEDERLEVVSEGECLNHRGYRTRGPENDGHDQVPAVQGGPWQGEPGLVRELQGGEFQLTEGHLSAPPERGR